MRLRFRFAFWRQRHGLPNLGHVRRGTSLTWWRALIWPYHSGRPLRHLRLWPTPNYSPTPITCLSPPRKDAA